MKRKVYSIALFVWTFILFLALLMPKNKLMTKPRFIIDIPHIDKAVHIFLFGVFAFLLTKFLSLQSLTRQKLITKSISLTLVLSLLTEVLQKLLSQWIERNFSWLDVLADLIGASLALIIYFFIRKK
ncbi:MAG: VanZ family protein [Bacteroidales bacterium]|jgi:VanZ family protein|nr:VanZ family protein [Bacteroidales bacterium]